MSYLYLRMINVIVFYNNIHEYVKGKYFYLLAFDILE